MGPVTAVSCLLQHVTAIGMRQLDQMLQERLGIGMSQFKIMRILEKNPNVHQRKIAECLGQTEASISRQIKLLCDRGLLATQVNPKSRREHMTVLTPKGVKMTAAALEVIKDFSQPMHEQLTEKERQALDSVLEKFHDHVCAPGKPFSCERHFLN